MLLECFLVDFELVNGDLSITSKEYSENNPGFKHVDIMQIGNEPNQIEIQIFDKYQMKQINEAQNEILNYFKKRFN